MLDWLCTKFGVFLRKFADIFETAGKMLKTQWLLIFL